MKMKLYYAQGTCSLAPMIVAAWAGIELVTEAVNIRQQNPEYLQKNPMGSVPAFELDDGQVMTQVEAIIDYLSDIQPASGLAGNDPVETFRINQWNAFLSSDFHPAFKGIFGPARLITEGSDEELERVTSAARVQVDKVTGILDQQIGSGNHIVLNRRTTADAHAFAMLRWIRSFPEGLNPYPNVMRFMQTMEEDSAVQSALALEAQ
jgi:glutathione S-transferase